MNKLSIKTFKKIFKIILTTSKNKLMKTRKTTLMKTVNMKLQKKIECFRKSTTNSSRKLKINQNSWRLSLKKKKTELKPLNLKWRNNLNPKLSFIKKIVRKRKRRKRNWPKWWMTINLDLMNLIKVWSNRKKLCKLMKKKLRVWIDRFLN